MNQDDRMQGDALGSPIPVSRGLSFVAGNKLKLGLPSALWPAEDAL
jgi:hypothetical protein